MDVRRHLPLALPRRTLHLFGRYWVPLVAWYLIGEGVHDLLSEAGARIYVVNSVAAYSLLALAILAQVSSYVMMFLVVSPSLPTVSVLRGGGKRTLRETLDALSLALLPFLLVFSAWNLFEQDLNQLKYRAWTLYAVQEGWGPSFLPNRFTVWFAVAGIVAWLLVRVCEAITRRTLNRGTALLAAVFEANWMFFGIFGIMTLLGNLRDWARRTVAYQNVADVYEWVSEVLPPLPLRAPDLIDIITLDLGWLQSYQVVLTSGIALPLAWLAIAGACYGQQLHDVRTLIGERHLDRLEQAPTVLQRWARKFPPEAIREKYYPPLYAVRLIGAAGVPAILFFCLCYGMIYLLNALATQLIAAVVGPHGPLFWESFASLIPSVTAAVAQPLRICLLAAAFDLALAAFNARTGGTAVPEAAESATGGR